MHFCSQRDSSRTWNGAGAARAGAGGRATTQKFNTWVTDRLKEQANINKQTRLWREEQRHRDHQDGEHERPTKGKGKGKDKKRKKKDTDAQGEGEEK